MIGACGAPPARPAPPAPDQSEPPATAVPPTPATFFVGAQQGKDLFVLAYRTQTGTLEPVGGALPAVPEVLAEHPPQPRKIERLWRVSDDRVIAIVGRGIQAKWAFAGERGRDWRLLAAAGEGGHISEDRELIRWATHGQHEGREVLVDRVIAWDGQIVFETRLDERQIRGFLQHGRRWITFSRRDQSERQVHGIGEPARPATAADKLYQETVWASDRFELAFTYAANNDIIHRAIDRATGREVGRYEPPPVGKASPSPNLMERRERGDAGAISAVVLYAAGLCGDIPCVSAWALDVWTFGPAGTRIERLRQTPGPNPPIDLVAPMIDEAVRNVVWIADRSVLGHHDIATGARRLIQTRYELLMTESKRR